MSCEKVDIYLVDVLKILEVSDIEGDSALYIHVKSPSGHS